MRAHQHYIVQVGRMSREVLLEAQTMMSTTSQEEVELQTESVTASSVEDGKFVFHFNLPGEGLGLRGVGIVDGKPEFRFSASPNTPTISEEEIAAALRLAYEDKRPEFFYIRIPPGHPFFGRQFKQYKPQWLRKTSFGETLAEADWKMKCLQIGARSNENKTEFWAWKNTSKLEGLASTFDFRKTQSSGSVIMSCNLVKVQKGDNEMRFVGEPWMRINAESNMRYSKYISKHFRAIAYHDEPLFLKVQELIKLVLAAEWLVKKGLKVDEDWMMNRTRATVKSRSQPQAVKAIETNGCTDAVNTVKEPLSEMIPQPVNFNPPNRNVTVTTKEAEENRAVAKKGVRRRYGWYDRGLNEGVMFDQDGSLFLRQRSLKMVYRQNTSVNGELTEVGLIRLHLALPPNADIPPMSEFGHYATQLLPTQSAHQEFTNALGPISADIKVENDVTDKGLELKVTREFQPSHLQTPLHVVETITAKISVDDFDTLYSGMDPNKPIWPEIPGTCEAVIPNVNSWTELYNETVPWPHTWQSPYIGVGEPVAGGGVSTRHIPVREEAIRPRKPVTETSWKDNVKRRGQELVVRGLNVISQGMFSCTVLIISLYHVWFKAYSTKHGQF